MQGQESRVGNFISLSSLFRRMSPNDMQILAAILLKEKKTRNAGFSFMEKVYVRISGGQGRNYLHNFVLGYVLDADKESVRIISETGQTALTMPNDTSGTTLYTAEQFAPIRAEIAESGKWVDPEVTIARARMASIQTLDEADAAGLLETPTAARRKVKKVKKKDDLVSFVAKMNRGFIKSRSKAGSEDEVTFSW